MTKKNFSTHRETGLVNLECYLPYLPDPPDSVPIDPPKYQASPWVRQHVYFDATRWRQRDAPTEDVDPRLFLFRSHWTNQLIMRRAKEAKVHRDFKDHVEPPPSLILGMGLEELEHLDRLGAATLGKDIVVNPEMISDILPGTGGPWLAEYLSDYERADIFDVQAEQSRRALEGIKVIDEHIVTSALKRMGKMLGDNRLEQMARERLAEDKRYYPIHTPSYTNLYSLSNKMLKEACTVEQIEEYRQIHQELHNQQESQAA